MDIPRDSTGAPKAGKPSSRFQAQMKKVMADKDKVAELKKSADTSIYYDHQSPSVRSRRKRAQQEFEWFVCEHLELAEPDQAVIWNKETFTDLTKLWLGMVAEWTGGRIGTKPKAGILFQRKDAIYWWAIRKIDGFTQIYGKWHAELVGMITFLADSSGFEKGNFQKNMLTDSDLALFFKALETYTRGRDGWKQAYVMWIMVYLTGVRPGSFTVSTGYEKGAPLGDGRLKRSVDETLRWSDVEFLREKRGIIVKIKFRYLKGHRNPYSSRDTVQAEKTWTFVPSTSSRYEFDLSLLMTGLAFSRGLFKASTLEQLLDGDEMYPPRNDDIDANPVFLASGQDEKLLKGVAMRLTVVNDKLRKICNDHGYYGRNTMYSFRRTALIDTKRKHGTEVAQETATHKPEGTTIYSYDSGMSRKELRELYSQKNTAKLDIAPSSVQSARKDEMSIRTDNMVLADTDFIKIEQALRSKMEEIAAHFGEEEEIGAVRQVGRFQEKLREGDTDEDRSFLAELDQMLKDRKNLKRKLRAKYTQSVKEEMLAEHKRNMKAAREGARPKLDVMKDQRVDSRSIVDDADARITGEINNIAAAAGDEDDDEDESEIDFDMMDEEQVDTVQEEWSNLPDEVTLDVSRDDEGDVSATTAGRLAFLRAWIHHRSDQTSGLPCTLCELDDTVPQNRKDERHTMYKLNRHVKSGYHSRMSQILRALSIDQGSNATAKCPLCDENMTARGFEAHLREEHPEQLE